MKKMAIFAFNGEPMCFVHVLLNALDLHEHGHEVRVIIEGSATKLVEAYANEPGSGFAPLYRKVKDAGLIACVCKACAVKMGALASAEAEGLGVCDEMKGHPSVARYLADGYDVLTF